MNNNSEFDFVNTFPPLGHPEHHFNKHPDHPWLKDKESITKWLKENDLNYVTNSSYYLINKDMTVSIGGANNTHPHILIFNKDIPKLPIQFRKCHQFQYMKCNSKSLVGIPYICNELNVSNNSISSWDGLPKTVSTAFLNNNQFTSFVGMPIFNKDSITIDVRGNKISSWDGFTNASTIYWWLGNISRNVMKQIFATTPDSVDSFFIHGTDYMPEIKLLYPPSEKNLSKIKNNDSIFNHHQIDPKWIEEQRRLLKSTNDTVRNRMKL